MKKTPAAMVEVLFLGPAHRMEAFGQIVKRGESALFTEAEVYALRAEDRIRIEVLGHTDGAAAPEPAAGDGEGHAEVNDTKE